MGRFFTMTPVAMNRDSNVNTHPLARQCSARMTRAFRRVERVALLFLFGLLAACQSDSQPTPLAESLWPDNLQRCPDERPEVCTQQYDPVCGYFHPAPKGDGLNSSKEWATENGSGATRRRTFGNGCSACLESDVVGFTRGACDAGTTR